MSVRNFDNFEENHWYIYTEFSRERNWTPTMEKVLNHNPVKCLKTYHDETPCSQFSVVGIGVYNWKNGFNNWIEIEDPTKKNDMIKKGEKFYDPYKKEIITCMEEKGISSYYNFHALKRKEKVEIGSKSNKWEIKLGEEYYFLKEENLELINSEEYNFAEKKIDFIPEDTDFIVEIANPSHSTNKIEIGSMVRVRRGITHRYLAGEVGKVVGYTKYSRWEVKIKDKIYFCKEENLELINSSKEYTIMPEAFFYKESKFERPMCNRDKNVIYRSTTKLEKVIVPEKKVILIDLNDLEGKDQFTIKEMFVNFAKEQNITEKGIVDKALHYLDGV